MGLPKPNEASTSKETMDATSSGVKRKRGITSMRRIVKNKNTGKKLVVEYTPKGKPYGKVASELASYIGVLARTTVPISVESWPKVEKDLKNKIWESVEAAFVLAPKSRKMVLTSASNRWRQFKSDLTRKYIMPFKDEAEALKNPPEDYGFIKQQHWQQFVNGRLTKEFQKLHNEQKERRAKFQQPHRMSRKGYVGLEAESRKTMPEDELDGSLLCKKARKDRKGQAAKIDLLTKEHSEHSDHSEHAEYAEHGEHSEHTEQSEHAEPSEHVEHSEHSEHLEHSEHPEHSEQFDVSLSSKNNDVLTMALGAPEDSGRVRGVGGFFKPNVPQAQFDREDILDEVRKMIEQQRAWYEAKIAELEAKINGNIRTTPISLSTPVPNRSEKASCSGKKKNVLEDNAINFEELTFVGKRDTIKKRGKTAAKPQDLPKQDMNLPKSLKLLYRYAERAMLDGETISIDMEEAVFGVAKTVYISQEDVMQFMEMKEISATCIIVYMRHLYDKLNQSNMVDMVGLTDPSSISVGAGDSDQKSRVIAGRLQKGSADQILLVPYNSGYHWMLTIISEDKDVCYFMDPLQRYFMDSLRRSMREEEWKYIVNNGIRQFNIQTGRGVRKPPVWKVLTGPKQPSNMECGYYVMRYMKEIVEDENLSFAVKWNGKTLNAYTQTELDEVRCEWTDIISDHM
ncbi:PREDICTED: uncharacterized protein LOC103334016 [Prunus mume]|uniref:Uncharacterized protein LOC103334016 n=1 Tax=Prunus mume TaxID=102107 RepID=A0ABM0P6S1_PRUMU|nr:PREDICTED: uncharacterized protein LOC103334016 [Prunus mume]